MKEDTFNALMNNLQNEKQILAIALGGSRGRNTALPDSDYDIFCVTTDKDFMSLKKRFTKIIMKTQDMKNASYMWYLEYWGYIYKAYSSDAEFDIAIIPERRIEEMSVRKNHKILYDPYGIYQEAAYKAVDDRVTTEILERERLDDYKGLFYIELKRFHKAIADNDYWLALTAVERMKIYFIHVYRITKCQFPKTQYYPEKKFDEICEKNFREFFCVDGCFETLNKTALNFQLLFESLLKQ